MRKDSKKTARSPRTLASPSDADLRRVSGGVDDGPPPLLPADTEPGTGRVRTRSKNRR